MSIPRSTTISFPASQLFLNFEPMPREHVIGTSKCEMIENIVEQIAETIEIENVTGSNIRLHVIKFNDEACTFSKNPLISSKEFMRILNLRPHDCTDFMSAKEHFDRLIATFQSRYVSLFLSDGMHNAHNHEDHESLEFEKTYDYTVGVGDDLDVDSDTLTKLGNEYFQSTNKFDIENFIIGNIFSDINTCHETMQVSIYVPSYITVDSAIEREHNLCSSLPPDIGHMPVQCDFSKTENNNLGITITPIFIHEIVDDLDVVLLVDESGSMQDNIYDNTGINIPVPDIGNSPVANSHPVQDLISSAISEATVAENILETVQTTNTSESDDETREMLTSLTQVLEQRLNDIHVEDTISVFDNEEDYTNYGRKFVKYTFSQADKVDKYYRLHALLENCSNTDSFAIEIKINDTIYRKTFYISNEFFDNMNVCEELIIIEKAINKIVNSERTSLRRNYIRELYSYVNNLTYVNSMENMLETFYNSIDTEVHKFKILRTHIDMLYNSIMTVGELGHEIYNNHNLGSLQREISTRICRQLSQSQQSDPSANIVNSRADNVEKDCIICYSKPKTIIYNCGHLVSCKDCTMSLLYGNQVNDSALYNDINNFRPKLCPTCRQTITGYVELNISSFTCCTAGCVMPPTIVCCDCKDIIYCKSCWNTNIRSAYKKKKRKRLECKCGASITKYIEAIY